MTVRYVSYIVLMAAATGCAREHYPDDTFAGPSMPPEYTAPPGQTGGAITYDSGAAPTVAGAPPQSFYPPPTDSRHAPAYAPPTSAPALAVPSAPLQQATPPMAPAQAQPGGWPDPLGTAAQPATAGPIAPLSYTEEVEAKPESVSAPEAPTTTPKSSAQQNHAGRDEDFRWISGTLDYVTMDGKWQVRYAPYSVENDRFGGSLLLEDDPRLRDFEPGDMVYVEGEVVEKPTRMLRDGAVYRIQRIRRVEQAAQS